VLQDLRFAARTLAGRPGFAAAAILSLALGVGATTVMFTVVDGVLLRPLPFPRPADLVLLWQEYAPYEAFGQRLTTPHAKFAEWRARAGSFSAMAGYETDEIDLTGEPMPLRVELMRATGGLLELLGLEPLRGRPFSADEAVSGERVALIAHDLWRQRFGAAEDVVGAAITLDGEAYRVIGVLPPEFAQFRSADVLVPLPMEAEARYGFGSTSVIARLRDGVSPEQAEVEMRAISDLLAAEGLAAEGFGVWVLPLHDAVVGEVRSGLWMLAGAVGLVLLIACANVANLLLARATGRGREVSVRAALGAGRGRLVRQFAVESLLLTSMAGALGVVLAAWGMDVVLALAPREVPRVEGIGVDPRGVAFAALVSAIVGLLFGLIPAGHAAGSRLADGLHGSAGSGRRSSMRLRGAFVVAQIALALVLMIGAGLLVNSFARLISVDPGFAADNLLTVDIELPHHRYSSQGRALEFYRAALARLEALPGAESVAIGSNYPLSGTGMIVGIEAEGVANIAENSAVRAMIGAGGRTFGAVSMRHVSPDYFTTLGITLREGRGFTPADDEAAPRVAVINASMARGLWGEGEALGKRLRYAPREGEPAPPWMTVVGVFDDIRQEGLAGAAGPEMVLPFPQDPAMVYNRMNVLVRARGEPLDVAAAVRDIVWSVDPDLPMAPAATMEQLLAGTLAAPRFYVSLLGAFGGVALLLAGLGVYGVMAYSVAQRTREIGIRVAIGARKADVLRMVARQGSWLTLIGFAVGLTAALALTRWLQALLFEVSATDPLTIVAVTLVLAVVATLATAVPALRATKVDPLVALRSD
jgi:putative ABC transport system permease protein